MLTTDQASASLDAAFQTTFTWNYDRQREGLDKLYEKAKAKAKANQWNATTDLDWSLEIDPEREIHRGAESMGVPVG